MTTAWNYTHRAAIKLHQLLDELGYPFDVSGRAAMLAHTLQRSPEAAATLLSGETLWTLDDLAAVSAQFEQRSCFFLEQFHADLPSDVQTVTSADGGEAIVWRMPQDFAHESAPSASLQLRYIRSRQAFGPFPPGSLVIYAEQALMARDLRPGKDYVVTSATGLTPMRCLDVQDTAASFWSGNKSEQPYTLPLKRQDTVCVRVAGALAGIICPATHIPPPDAPH